MTTAYLKPESLSAALAARRDHPDYTLIAGCTDVMVAAREKPEPVGLIDVFGLGELVGISERDGAVEIGAATPYAAIRTHPLVGTALPGLALCVSQIGAAQIQARGTLGGNVATSSPVGDALPVLLALGASIRLASTRGPRTLPYDGFCTGYRQTLRAPDELIVAISIPIPPAGTRQYWRKVGTRQAQAISKVSVAAAARIAADGTFADCRVAMGAVAATPIRLPTVEALLEGQRAGPELAEGARAAAEAAIVPIDDVRSSAEYRRMAAANLVRRFVLEGVGP